MVTPESQGLSFAALDEAEKKSNEALGLRSCFLVTKNGKIVYEKYRLNRTKETVSELFSGTKTMCASLFGTAVQQGWASDLFKLNEHVPTGSRLCNPNATFRNVMTMTGESADLEHPTFKYDYEGVECLDTIQDFINENNPDKIPTPAWKDKHWAKPLGLEHMQWNGVLNYLPCGLGAATSARDAARVGQL